MYIYMRKLLLLFVNFLIGFLGNEKENVSDKFHTFKELYDCRMALNVALFNELARSGTGLVHKSKRHYNEENECFGGGWFIVVAVFEGKQISFHYPNEYFDLFHCVETKNAKFEFDGHETKDVIERLSTLYPTPKSIE